MTVVARKKRNCEDQSWILNKQDQLEQCTLLLIARKSPANPIYESRVHIYSDWISSLTHASGNAECGKSIIFISFQSSATLNYKFLRRMSNMLRWILYNGTYENANLVKRTSRLHNFNINVKHIEYVWHYFHICPQQDERKKNSNRKYCILETTKEKKAISISINRWAQQKITKRIYARILFTKSGCNKVLYFLWFCVDSVGWFATIVTLKCLRLERTFSLHFIW